MEIADPPTKRIKVEHSYASSTDDFDYPISIKQERSVEESDVAQTIKIEIEDVEIKTEPVESVEDAQSTFEYFNVPVENEPKIPMVQPLDINIAIKTESEIPSENVNFPVIFVKDPLELVRHDFQNIDEIKQTAKTPNEKKNREEKSSCENTSEIIESKSFLRLQKERDKLQKQVQKLRADLKLTKAREKTLQIELSARRLIEINLEEKSKVLENKLQESTKQEKANYAIILELKKKIERENLSHVESSKSLKVQLEKLKSRLKIKELEHKVVDKRYDELNRVMVQLNKKFELQTTVLNQKSKQLSTTQEALANSRNAAQLAKSQVVELKKEVNSLTKGFQEIQTKLVNEQNTNKLYVKERDQQQQILHAKLADVQLEVGTQKQIIASLTAALTHKVNECKSQKDVIKTMKLNAQRQGVEFALKLEELKKELELRSKECQYCGF